MADPVDLSGLLARNFQRALDDCMGFCESPIESALLLALIHALLDAGRDFEVCWPGCNRWRSPTGEPENFSITPQHEIDAGGRTYRADLFVEYTNLPTGTTKRVVVEADGHDFHERTKEQAKRDRQRDRDMQGEGYSVLRFTGSEIHADAAKCASEIVKHATSSR